MKRLQTWRHRCPVETPASSTTTTIRVVVDVHGIGLCCDHWRHEVTGRIRRDCGVATAFVHQDCPVPICDFDMAAWAFVNISADSNSKLGELQPQCLPTLYLYSLCFVDAGRVAAGVVWRRDNTCGRYSFKLNSSRERFFDNCLQITHPRCHSRLQGKAMTSARVRLQWSSQGHRPG